MKTVQVAFLLLLVASARAVASEHEIFTAEDVFGLEYADDPRISPDGSRIVYERRSNDVMTDRARVNLWLIDVDGGGHRPLVSGTQSASSPRWSADGGRIAYLQATGLPETDTGTGIFVRWMDSGMTGLVAELQRPPEELTWSADGRWLAFVMAVPATSEPLVKPREKPEGAEWSEPVKVIDSVTYRWDGEGFLEPAYKHIFVIPAEGGTPRQLTSGDFDHEGPLSWTPDGEKILFAANRHAGWELESGESDLYAVAVADGALTPVTTRQGGEAAPAVSPDGRYIAYLADANEMVSYNRSVLHVMAVDGSGDRALTDELDRSVANIGWSGNGRIFFQYDDRGVRKVARTNLDGELSEVTANLGSTSLGRPYTSGSYTVARDGTVAYTHGTAYRPAEIAVAGRKNAVLTSLNDDLFADIELGEVTEIVYTSSFDGQEIQGWYITPPGYEKGNQYPLVLEIHGGPHLAYGPYFSAEMQLMAAAGYIVFYDNHRGSTGYGTDFAMLLHYKYSSPADFADHMSGIDAMIAKGMVDEDNLFITGGSAGGIASAYAIGLTDRFNAAAVAKPVINWISKTLTGDAYIGQISHQFPGMPWEEFQHYWERSPLSLVGNMDTPTMLITGEEDYRTPISETEQLYQALQLKGVDVVMVRVPGSPHGIAGRPSRLISKVDHILAWFSRYRTNDDDDDE